MGSSERKLGHWAHALGWDTKTWVLFCLSLYFLDASKWMRCLHHMLLPWCSTSSQAQRQQGQVTMKWILQNFELKWTFPLFKSIYLNYFIIMIHNECSLFLTLQVFLTFSRQHGSKQCACCRLSKPDSNAWKEAVFVNKTVSKYNQLKKANLSYGIEIKFHSP
jgi:hypothetical protein